jgi:hypothetical protein
VRVSALQSAFTLVVVLPIDVDKFGEVGFGRRNVAYLEGRGVRRRGQA